MAEVGDRVKLKAKLPARDMQTGWQGEAGHSEATSATWSDHFGGLPGVVDAIDVPNNEVRVRGRDANGNDFTLWIGHEYLDVTRGALDFEGER